MSEDSFSQLIKLIRHYFDCITQSKLFAPFILLIVPVVTTLAAVGE